MSVWNMCDTARLHRLFGDRGGPSQCFSTRTQPQLAISPQKSSRAQRRSAAAGIGTYTCWCGIALSMPVSAASSEGLAIQFPLVDFQHLKTRTNLVESLPEGQTFCLVIYGYPVTVPSVPKPRTLHVSPVVIFTDSVVFGGMPPLWHRVAGVAAIVGGEVSDVKGIDYATDHVLEKDWQAMNESIARVFKTHSTREVTSQHILDALPHGYSVPNSAFAKVTLSKKRGWLDPHVDITLAEKGWKRRKYSQPARFVDMLERNLRVAFGERFELKGR
jgi:hypothetical protein